MVITKIPVMNDNMLKINKMLEFLSPEYLNISISLFSKIFIKKSWIVINIMNGNNSNSWIGEFKRDKNNVKLISTFSFLKNSSSLNKFNKKTKQNIMIKTNRRDLKKILDKKFMYTLIFYFLRPILNLFKKNKYNIKIDNKGAVIITKS